jgi:hypothetical protein
MNTVLKITEDIRDELSAKGIVICTYILTDDSEADCIDIEYSSEYPNLEQVEYKPINYFPIPGVD